MAEISKFFLKSVYSSASSFYYVIVSKPLEERLDCVGLFWLWLCIGSGKEIIL